VEQGQLITAAGKPHYCRLKLHHASLFWLHIVEEGQLVTAAGESCAKTLNNAGTHNCKRMF
jgi:hypothetical protein